LHNKDNLSYEYYISAKNQFKKLDSLNKIAKINIELVSLLLAINNNNIDYNIYLKEAVDYAINKNNPAYLSSVYKELGKSFYDTNPLLAIRYFTKAERESVKAKNELLQAQILQNIGATFAKDEVGKPDSALYVYEKALVIYKQLRRVEGIYNIYTNKGVAFTKKKEYDQALKYLLKADSISIKEYTNKNKEALYGFMSNAYKGKGDYKKALEYSEKQKVFQEILDENEQKKAIKEIDSKYRTKEKEKENQSLKASLQKNQRIIYAVVFLLAILLIIGILIYQNIAKKKQIAEQEKYIETQKLEKLLKEQELNQIDLILESQEKERQLIANQLHDSLGSLLATLKLNFQNIKRQSYSHSDLKTNLYLKTDELIEDAYQEVRNLSHLKNSGVIGNEGLLVSVKKMAEKMTIIDKLQFTVIPFGLHERLENTIEVTIFRMIQELCANAIKHAHASEVNIYITQHNASEINVMIEDNGMGFDINKLQKTSGIGLKNLQRKAEYMGGTFTIDSVLSKGTTIIIDLPL
jgi:signal transduction histidine kinase